MYNVFYNRTMGAWYDYNMRENRHNTKFYPSIAVPLFTGCYHMLNQQKSERLFKLMHVSFHLYIFFLNFASIVKKNLMNWNYWNQLTC